MLSKAIRPLNNQFVRTGQKAFGTNPGILHKVFNTLDKGTHAYGVARFDPNTPLKGFKSIETSDVPHEYNVTNLTNGFTVYFLITPKSGAMRVIGAVICCTILRHLFPRKFHLC